MINKDDFNDLELVVATIQINLNCHLNINLIARKIELDELIIGKKMLGVVQEGDVRIVKTSNNNENDFSNQMTIVINNNQIMNKNYNDNTIELCEAVNKNIINNVKKNKYFKLNLKIFRTSTIIVTGSLCKEDAKFGVNTFIDKIKDLKESVKLKENYKITELFSSVKNYYKFIKKNFLVLLYLFFRYKVSYDMKLYYIMQDIFMDDLSFVEENELYFKLLKIVLICRNYYCEKELLFRLKNDKIPKNILINSIIDDLYKNKEVILTISLNEPVNPVNHNPDIIINNYNSVLKCNFNINRPTLSNLLTTKYKNDANIISVCYEPTKYPGINIKYLTTSNKIISLLVFQEGKIMITGCNNWSQNLEGYKFIVETLSEVKTSIEFFLNKKETKGKNNKLIIKFKEAVFINIKEHILKNPHHMYLLKKQNLLHLYI